MITKATIEEIQDEYTAKVRIPIFDGIADSRNGTSVNDLSYATICTIPNSNNTVNVGDVVFVSFEDDDLGKPVILGHLLKSDPTETYQDLQLRLLTTTSTTKLNKDTYIGDIKPQEIAMLKNAKFNLQDQINNNLNLISTLQSDVKTIQDTYVTLGTDQTINGNKTFSRNLKINSDSLSLGSNSRTSDAYIDFYTYGTSGTRSARVGVYNNTNTFVINAGGGLLVNVNGAQIHNIGSSSVSSYPQYNSSTTTLQIKALKSGDTNTYNPSIGFEETGTSDAAFFMHNHKFYRTTGTNTSKAYRLLDEEDLYTERATNPITSTSDDTVTKWAELGSGMYWFNTLGYLIDQPNRWGWLLNIAKSDKEVFQIWHSQNSGPMYLRSGNASGWAGTWRQVSTSNWSNGMERGNTSAYSYVKYSNGLLIQWGVTNSLAGEGSATITIQSYGSQNFACCASCDRTNSSGSGGVWVYCNASASNQIYLQKDYTSTSTSTWCHWITVGISTV